MARYDGECRDEVRAFDEESDHRSMDDYGGCRRECSQEEGYDCALELCERSVCVEVCGDGVRTASEGCDDGNLVSGDGCSMLCVVEVMQVLVRQVDDFVSVQWRVPSFSNIVRAELTRTDVFANSTQTEEFSASIENCVSDGASFVCNYDTTPFSLPSGPGAPRFLVSVRSVSSEEKDGSAGDSGVLTTFFSTIAEAFIDVIGYPSSVHPVSLLMQTVSLWSISWSQPALFFANLDPHTKSYELSLRCSGPDVLTQDLRILYTDAQDLRLAVFVANFDTTWTQASDETGDAATVQISAQNYNSSATCFKGSDVAIQVRAFNRLFGGPVSRLELVVIATPTPPSSVSVDEIATGFQVEWNQVSYDSCFDLSVPRHFELFISLCCLPRESIVNFFFHLFVLVDAIMVSLALYMSLARHTNLSPHRPAAYHRASLVLCELQSKLIALQLASRRTLEEEKALHLPPYFNTKWRSLFALQSLGPWRTASHVLIISI